MDGADDNTSELILSTEDCAKEMEESTEQEMRTEDAEQCRSVSDENNDDAMSVQSSSSSSSSSSGSSSSDTEREEDGESSDEGDTCTLPVHHEQQIKPAESDMHLDREPSPPSMSVPSAESSPALSESSHSPVDEAPPCALEDVCLEDEAEPAPDTEQTAAEGIPDECTAEQPESPAEQAASDSAGEQESATEQESLPEQESPTEPTSPAEPLGEETTTDKIEDNTNSLTREEKEPQSPVEAASNSDQVMASPDNGDSLEKTCDSPNPPRKGDVNVISDNNSQKETTDSQEVDMPYVIPSSESNEITEERQPRSVVSDEQDAAVKNIPQYSSECNNQTNSDYQLKNNPLLNNNGNGECLTESDMQESLEAARNLEQALVNDMEKDLEQTEKLDTVPQCDVSVENNKDSESVTKDQPFVQSNEMPEVEGSQPVLSDTSSIFNTPKLTPPKDDLPLERNNINQGGSNTLNTPSNISGSEKFHTIDIDVTQLGLESPTSMGSSEMNNSSVETTPSQTFSDCAQAQNNFCGSNVNSSPGNYMETVNSSTSNPMASPVGSQITSPAGNSQANFNLNNAPPPTGHSGFSLSNQISSPSNQTGNFTLQPIPDPSSTPTQNFSITNASPPVATSQNFNLSANQSPSNATQNFSVPANPSPSNQSGANFSMPNANPSPVAKSNSNFNMPNMSPGTNYTNLPTPSPTNSNGSFSMAASSPNANPQNFVVPQNPTQHSLHPGPQPQQATPVPQVPQHHTAQQAPQVPQVPQHQTQHQQQIPHSATNLQPNLQPGMNNSAIISHSYPLIPVMTSTSTHRLSHCVGQNSCAVGTLGTVPRLPVGYPQQNSSCSLAKLQQLTNGIPGMELLPDNTMTPPPTLTPPPMNPMTPPPSIQRNNMTPPVPNMQSQIPPPPSNHYKQYPRRQSSGMQKNPNVTVNPNMTFTPNVTIQPGTNMIGYNMMNLNAYRMPQQVLNTSYIPNASFIQQPQMNMMGMNMMNMHPQPPNFQQQVPPAQSNNPVYTTYGYINSSMPPQAFNMNVANMNGVMRR